MSSDIGHQNQEHIAGEPAGSQAKPIPPLNGNHTASQGTVKTPSKKPRKVLQVIQIFSIIIALILSAYSFTIIQSLPDEAGQAGADANEVLVRTEGRNADYLCEEGGADIFIGNDLNTNGILEENEVTSTTRLCHGKTGLSGPQGATGPNGGNGIASLVNTSVLNYGNDTCFYGGLLIESGLDLNNSATLEDSEVISQDFVCNGVIGSNGINGDEGYSALVEQVQPPQYLCSSGFIINFGIDNGHGMGIAEDGIMHADEVIDSLKVCQTPLNHGPISDMFAGVSDGYSSQCAEFAWSDSHDKIITSGSDSASGCELWISSGIASSTEQLIDINSGVGDSNPGLFLGFNQIISNDQELWLFDANSGSNGRELWASNLSNSGTYQLTGYSGDGINSDSIATLWMNGLVFSDSANSFMWTDGVNTTELFNAPFIDQQQQLILDTIAADISSHTTSSTVVDSTGLWFSAISNNIGFEMFHLSNQGNLTVWNLNEFEDSMPDSILAMSNSAVVIADNGINGRQLVNLDLDGTHQWLTSLTLQSNGNPTTSVGEGMGLNLLEHKIIFDAQTSAVDPTLWSYDLATSSVTELSSLVIAPGLRTQPVQLNGKLWFDCITGTTAGELCTSDGTQEGTKMIYEFQPGMASSEIRAMVGHGQHLIILVNGEVDSTDTGHSLWSFDTNSLAAELTYDPWSGTGNNSNAGVYGQLVATSELVMFVADDGQTGHELHIYSPLMLGDDWLIW
jgi:ELWxxDGT repeat protein